MRRQMVLNNESVRVPCVADLYGQIADVAKGIAVLVNRDLVETSMRATKNIWQIVIRDDGYSLGQACYKDISDRETRQLLLTLLAKSPSDSEKDPLSLCADLDGIIVGLPSAPEWDHHQFDFVDKSKTIRCHLDQLTRCSHSDEIWDRHRANLSISTNPGDLWKNRNTIFPHLGLGPGIEHDLVTCSSLLPPIVRKLTELDRAAKDWKDCGILMWPGKVTDESATVKNDPKKRAKRTFKSQSGDHKLFMWHARCGSSIRLHLRVCSASHEIEIGYVGTHL